MTDPLVASLVTFIVAILFGGMGFALGWAARDRLAEAELEAALEAQRDLSRRIEALERATSGDSLKERFDATSRQMDKLMGG